jgi:hypothetical protein
MDGIDMLVAQIKCTDLKVNLKKTSIMVLVLKKGAGKKEIDAIEKKLYSQKTATGFNAKKYNGVLKLKDEPMAIQKKMRNEWERDFS